MWLFGAILWARPAKAGNGRYSRQWRSPSPCCATASQGLGHMVTLTNKGTTVHEHLFYTMVVKK